MSEQYRDLDIYYQNQDWVIKMNPDREDDPVLYYDILEDGRYEILSHSKDDKYRLYQWANSICETIYVNGVAYNDMNSASFAMWMCEIKLAQDMETLDYILECCEEWEEVRHYVFKRQLEVLKLLKIQNTTDRLLSVLSEGERRLSHE